VILNILLIVLVGLPLLLIAAQGLVVLARLLGLSQSEMSTREEFSRITFEGSQTPRSAALTLPVPEADPASDAPAIPDPQSATAAPVPLEWRSCPTCGDAITTHARICRHCGDVLPKTGQTSGLAISREA
jgi:hypothetical protein